MLWSLQMEIFSHFLRFVIFVLLFYIYYCEGQLVSSFPFSLKYYRRVYSVSGFIFIVALRPQRPWGLLGTGSPGRPPPLPHSSSVLCLCFPHKTHAPSGAYDFPAGGLESSGELAHPQQICMIYLSPYHSVFLFAPPPPSQPPPPPHPLHNNVDALSIEKLTVQRCHVQSQLKDNV